MNILKPYINKEEPLTLEDYVKKRFLNGKIKASTLFWLKNIEIFVLIIWKKIDLSETLLNPQKIQIIIYNPNNAHGIYS